MSASALAGAVVLSGNTPQKSEIINRKSEIGPEAPPHHTPQQEGIPAEILEGARHPHRRRGAREASGFPISDF